MSDTNEDLPVKDNYILTPFFLDEPRSGLNSLEKAGWQRNQPSLPAGDKIQKMIALYRPLKDRVAEVIRQGNRPVSIAGDCCTTIGVLAGLAEAGINPTLIWLDAHGDFNTWETTPSGFLGGMPLAMLVGRGEQTLLDGTGLKAIPESQVILSDARDLDPDERLALASSDVNMMPEVTGLLEAPLPEGPVYVHFDIDVIDPEEAPAMSYPAPAGPSVKTLRHVFRQMTHTSRIVALSVSAWNPDMDGADRTQEVVMGLIAELLVQ